MAKSNHLINIDKSSKKLKYSFLGVVIALALIISLIGTSLVVIASILPNSPYEIQEDPIVEEIWEDLGPIQRYIYISDNGEINILDIVENSNGLEFYNSQSNERLDIRVQEITIIGQDGDISYFERTNSLLVFYDNGTILDIFASYNSVWLDPDSGRFRLYYKQGDLNSINRNFGSQVETIGFYFVVNNRGFFNWLSHSLKLVRENFGFYFLIIGIPLMRLTLIGLGTGFLVALILSLEKLQRVISGPSFTLFSIKFIRSWIGSFLSLIPFFNFKGYWYLEEEYPTTQIDFSSPKSMLKELFSKRWRDILFIPAAIIAIIINRLVSNVSIEQKAVILQITPLFSAVVLVLLGFYFPIVFSTDDSGLKRVSIQDNNDVAEVKLVGEIIRDNLSVIFGFSGLIALGSIATEVTQSIAFESITAGKVPLGGFALDLVGLIFILIWTIGLLLVIIASLIVGSSFLALSYFEKHHSKNVVNLRNKGLSSKIANEKGTITSQLSYKDNK